MKIYPAPAKDLSRAYLEPPEKWRVPIEMRRMSSEMPEVPFAGAVRSPKT